MKDRALAKKREGHIVDIPEGYGRKIADISDTPKMKEFGNAIVQGLDGIIAAGAGKPQNAAHIVALFAMIISKLVKARWLPSDILAALNLVPKYASIIISNPSVRNEAVKFFNNEMVDLRKRL